MNSNLNKYLAAAALLLILLLPQSAGAWGLSDIGNSVKGAISTGASTLWDGFVAGIDKILGAAVAYAGSLFLMIASLVLAISGKAFNEILKFSVMSFSQLLDQVPAINDGWVVTRNLANVVMIFVILYIAVSIIIQLGSGDKKRLLARIIIIALLINFSAFFTRVVIDASNVLAYQFYQATTTQGALIAETFAGGLGLAFQALGESGMEIIKNLSLANAINQFYGKAIIMLVASFTLWTGVLLLLIRIVALVIILILAPLAFLAYATPGLEGQAKKWWEALLKQCFWLPIYLMFLYITTSIIKGGQVKTALEQSSGDSAAAGFLNSLIIIAFMLASIIVAKQLGAYGVSGAMKLAGAATGGLTAAGVWAAKQPLRGAGKILGAVDEKYLGGKMGKIYGGLKGSLGTAARTVGKVPGVGPLGRKVGEVVKHPITAAAAGLAAATAPYGIPSILGRLPKEEERKQREEERKEKEEERRQKVEEYKSKLKRFARVKKGEAGYEQAQKEAGVILREMKPKEVASLDDDTISAPALVFHYNSEILRAVGREGIKFGTMDKVWSQIKNDPAHPAHQYVKTNPLIRAVGGAVGGTPTTGEGGGPTTEGGGTPTQQPTPSATTPQTRVGIPVMITADMKQELFGLGYTLAEVNKLTPEQAHNIINNKTKAPET